MNKIQNFIDMQQMFKRVRVFHAGDPERLGAGVAMAPAQQGLEAGKQS